jgi:hypothetical protein
VKLKNSTSFPDYFLRRMVAWCCRQLEFPVRRVRYAQFRNRERGYSGHAWPGANRICVSVGQFHEVSHDQAERPNYDRKKVSSFCEVREPGKPVTYRVWTKIEKTLDERTNSLVRVTAHECAHLMLSCFGRTISVDSQKPHGRRLLRNGGSEQQTTWHENKLMELFLANRAALIAEWNDQPKVSQQESAVVSLADKRQAKAQAALDRWEKKLALAKTKVRKYQRQVRLAWQALKKAERDEHAAKTAESKGEP